VNLKLFPMVLIKPYRDEFPIGVYMVIREQFGYSIYSNGKYFYHDASRFVEPSSLILELF
jgi:hypothetical protein